MALDKTQCDYCKGRAFVQEPIGGSDHITCWKCAGHGYFLDNTLTPNDIYRLPFTEVIKNPSTLCGCYYDHLIGSGLEPTDVQFRSKDSDRIEIRIIRNFDFDGRRFWRLATVWFDQNPIMIIQNAGREGDDHSERFITDERGFVEMVGHIRILLNIPVEEVSDVVGIDAPLGRKLIEYYGNELDGHFQRYGYYT